MGEAKVHDMKVKRHSSDYTKFNEDAIAEAEDPVGGGDGELAPASGEMGAGGARFALDVEELHELMQQKQRGARQSEARRRVLPRRHAVHAAVGQPARASRPVGPFAAMVAYLQQMSALFVPQRVVEVIHTPVTRAYAEAIRYVGVQLTRLGLAGHWLHLGVGGAVPMMTTAGLKRPSLT